jgi:hypothetical protein
MQNTTQVSHFLTLEHAILTYSARIQSRVDLTNVFVVVDAIPSLLAKSFLIIVLTAVLAAIAWIIVMSLMDFVTDTLRRVSFG